MPAVTAFAPGRVNLIGEHTDYNDGLALPFAIENGVTVTARAANGGSIQALARDLGEEDEFALDDPPPAEGWRAFVRGVAAELGREGCEIVPATLEIEGDVPRGAGLSSSAALAVAVALALLAVADTEPPERIALAKLCSRVENDWVGAPTGLLDQLASLFGEPDGAVRIDFRALEVTPVALDLGEHRLVTLDSGETHSLAQSGYNDRRDECRAACERLGVSSLRDATLDAAAKLEEPLDRRAEHVIRENGRVDATVAALREGDFDEVGRLLNASHASLRDLYEVSTPAVEETAQRLIDAGALGARILGGGFGGSVLGLMAPGASPPDGAVEVRPGPGARILG